MIDFLSAFCSIERDRTESIFFGLWLWWCRMALLFFDRSESDEEDKVRKLFLPVRASLCCLSACLRYSCVLINRLASKAG